VSGSFEIVPGDPASRVVLHVPHSSRSIPAEVRAGIVLDDDALETELSAITDARTDEIALAAASRAGLRPWLFVNRLSRLVVDPERFPDDTEEMNAVGMGAVYERTTQRGVLRRPTDAERAALIADFFDPYAAALAELVRQRLADVGQLTILNVHSYPEFALPYELHGDGPRPEICLGTDESHTPPALVETARSAFAGSLPRAEVGLDSPFSGCYVPLDQYGTNPDVGALMLELRRDVVETHLDVLATAIAALVDDLAGD
jgi:N-formylglutamate deformylase